MSLVAQVYFLIFWIPAVVAVASLSIALSHGIVKRPLLFVAWCGSALVLQLAWSRFSPVWTVGLVLQTVLAVLLAIRLRMDG